MNLSLLLKPITAYAQDDISIKPTGPWENLANLTAGKLVSGAISLLMLLVALVFFFILLLGGLKWVTSEGDEKKVGAARAQITNALIGLAIVFAAWAIMSLIGKLFGIDIFNFEIPTFV